MKTFGIFACMFLSGAAAAWAQFPGAPPASSSSSSATLLPASGRNNEAGSVSAVEQPVPGTTSSVNTINPSIQIAGPFSGSTSSTKDMPFHGQLSLADALQRALAHNMGAIAMKQSLQQNRAQTGAARSALLPNLTGSVSATQEELDLATFGLNFAAPGFRIPSVVGPFHYYSLQVSLTQTLANLTSINNYRAARATARASQYSLEDTRDLITLAVGAAYLEALAAQARLDAAQVQLNTANAVFRQSSEQHEQGVLGRLNVDQNQVRSLTQQQQLITLRNDLAKQKISLARLTGLPPNADYQLTDTFPFSPAPMGTVEEAIAQAGKQRSDLKAAEAQVDAAAKALAAARAQRLPSLSASADYQRIGSTPPDSNGAYSVVGTLSIPIWQGGRVHSDIQQAQAVLEQRRAELEDTRGQIEAEVREVYLDLQAAAGQVDVARTNLRVAQETLEMTRARMQAGVVNTLEVVQAQQTVASAQLDLIDSIFAHNLAKLNLARTTGHASEQIPKLLKPATE